MQPSSEAAGGEGGAGAGPAGPGGRLAGVRRWGPVAALAVAVAVAAVIAAAGGGGEGDGAGGTGTPGATPVPTGVTTPEGDIIHPLSFSEAEQAGLEGLDWGERCDPGTGRVRVPDVAAAECYLPFEGDNGGATDQGVTADSITIVVYQGPEDDPIVDYVTDAVQVDDSNADLQHTLDRLLGLQATYHEAYGRRVEVVYYESDGLANDATAARADAVRIAEDIAPFQVWGGPALTEAFAEELAARGVQCLGCAGGDQHEFDERAPYGIGLGITSEQGMAHNVEALADQVAGRPARFAGDDELRDRQRRFGLLYVELNDETAALAERYRDMLEAEGVELVEMVPYTLDPASLQEAAGNAIARLKEAGVTTVILGGDPIAPREFTREATAQDWYPEWFLNLSQYTDTNVFARTYDQAQWAHAFGLTTLPARVDPEVAGPVYLYEWFHGEPPRAAGTLGAVAEQAELFHAVVQEAGPHLTHESFRDALFRLDPGPARLTRASRSWGDHGRWPGIEGHDWQGPDDVTKIWWDAEAEGPDELGQQGQGMWRFVDGGRRYLAGEWPDEDFRAFDEEGAVTLYDAVPAEEAPPDYDPLPPVRDP